VRRRPAGVRGPVRQHHVTAFDVLTGQVTASVGETRTEQDYANFLDTLFAAGAPTTK
jgi:hypothetical protein